MGRSVIVPHRVFDGDHITSGVTPTPATSREARPAEPSASNLGKLAPIPMGVPEADVDVDLFLRTSGNADGARCGWRDDGDVVGYKGKTSHIPYDMTFLDYGTTSASQPQRIKALPLDSGELLLVILNADDSIEYYTWDSTNGWSAATAITVNVVFDSIDGIDVVQTPDTKELILILLGDNSGGDWLMARYTSKGDTSSTIAWRSTPVRAAIGAGFGVTKENLTGMAMELIPSSGRIAMLTHSAGANTNLYKAYRSFSDDRGISWSPWAVATTYPEVAFAGASPSKFGGVSMTLTRTGSLIATVGVASGDAAADPPPGKAPLQPSTLCLVSDDGDTWGSITRVTSETGFFKATANVFDWPIREEGMIETAVAIGDDGLPRILGCLHGDTEGDTSTTLYDDFALLTLTKADISGSDIGPQIAEGTPLSVPLSPTHITCTDTLESEVVPEHGFLSASFTQKTAHRICALGGSPTGNLDGTGGSAPVYQGPRFIEVVNFRGALWVFAGFEDTTNTSYALGTFRINAWSTLNERVADVTDSTEVLRGYTYNLGYMAYTLPTNAGFSKAGTGAELLDAATGGLRLTTTADWKFYTFVSIPGTKGRPTFVRCKLKPTSGGSTTGLETGLRIMLNNTGNTEATDVDVRFSPTNIEIYDNDAAATIVSGSAGAIGTKGVELVIAFSDFETLLGVFFRLITDVPEDGVWTEMPVGLGALSAFAQIGGELIRFGNVDTGSAVSTWHTVLISRGDAASPNDTGLALNNFNGTEAWDADPPTFSEFVDDILAYDDGLRHGTRAPVCNSAPMYLRDRAKISWRGHAGVESDFWDIISNSSYSINRVTTTPTKDVWRSEDDAAIVNIDFDAGNDERWNPDAIALFKCNLKQFKVQFDTAPTFDSDGGNPLVDIDVDEADTGDIRRDYFRMLTASYSVAGADNREIAITPTSPNPLAPHQFRSDTRVTWYVYSSKLTKSFKIVDNDAYSIFCDEDVSGINDTGDRIAIYPDRIGLDLSGGNLGASGGYRYMRINIPIQELSEGYYQIGTIIAGNKFDLTDPHPDWGWSRTISAPVEEEALPLGGQNVTQLNDGALSTFSYSFSGLRSRPNRVTSSSFPKDRGGYLKLVDFLNAVKWGERVVALMPQYNDGRDGVDSRTFEVYPCNVLGPWKGNHAAYEYNACLSQASAASEDGTIKDILNVGPILFKETL